MTLNKERYSSNSLSFKFLENDKFQDTIQSEFKEAKKEMESPLFTESLYSRGNKKGCLTPSFILPKSNCGTHTHF
ncbi:hypothetical protein LguiA_019092 [Lonicera macranthoides]